MQSSKELEICLERSKKNILHYHMMEEGEGKEERE